MAKDVKFGKTVRRSFSKTPEVLKMPNLIEIQKQSYKAFIEEGLREVFNDMEPITDYTGNLELTFDGYELDSKTKYTVAECKERDATYACPLTVKATLRDKSTGEVIKKGSKDGSESIFMGDFPKMTDSGTFIINGAERVIISQIVRSPGVYYTETLDKTDKKIISTTVIPYRGAWIEYETDSNDVFYVRIDKNRKIPVSSFVRSLGIETDAEIKELFGENEIVLATLEKDAAKTAEESLIEMYKKLRPGEPATAENAKALINNLFFDVRRYDISAVGRYKYNKKLAVSKRIAGKKLLEMVIDPLTGEIIFDEGTILSREDAALIESKGVSVAIVEGNDGKPCKVIGSGMVEITDFVECDKDALGIVERVRFSVLREIMENFEGQELLDEIKNRVDDLIPKHIIIDEIVATISYLMNLAQGVGIADDIDHLGNRRLRSVGELLQNQFRIGFARMERVIRERMITQDLEVVTPQTLVNVRPVTAAIKEFFGSSPLSQFMDQTNPLAELTHKRRLSALGPGGLSRDRASFEVRDVHYSHYGRLCPIETPEGPNIGLINYLGTFGRVNQYGFIETPYRVINKETGLVTDDIMYMTADIEDEYIVCQANEKIGDDGRLLNNRITARFRDEIIEVEREQIDLMDISPRVMVSVATAMIPFLENDDANRALMGSNMQRQAVPLLKTEAPVVATGMEYRAAVDSGTVPLAEGSGVIERVTAREIIVKYDNGERKTYPLLKFVRSNQGTCINQRPIVNVGDRVEDGDVIADGPSTDQGEISLGKNALIAFMTWEGYNYEDAILMNERLVKEDVYTSIHIEEYEMESRDTKLGAEEITRDIPNVGEDALRDLDERGIIRIGAEVSSGDILVGKVTPKGETELTAEERLLRAIFGEKAREVRDSSLRVPNGERGIIVDVKIFTRENGDELSPGVNMVVRCYIAQKRKISVGDKMAGRHGNKGVISRIMPQEDMPFLPDGTPVDIVLNPLGVPSRMNIGQVLEVHLGMAAKALGIKIATPVFDGAKEKEIEQCLLDANMRPDGKTILFDGRTGEQFDNPVTVGYMYYLKLAHLVDDKIHARSTGPYSLVTQQPLGGKAQFGGQRFGEMEVWALEAYGAAYTLQEILTVKSDDVVGRVQTYEAIVKGQNVPKPGIPESFKVLVKELQSLGLDVKVLDENQEVIELVENEEEDNVYTKIAVDTEFETVKDTEGEFERSGFGIEDEDGEAVAVYDFDMDEDDFDDDFDDDFADEDDVDVD
ncbi:MAG: DNA-directed RNA polymerase subunit beta [Clostridia bacterium]